MNPTETMQRLIELRACEEAKEWAKDKTAQECWEQCHRGDWLLWWATKEGVALRELTLAKGRCAETVIHLMKDQRSKDAVQAAINYGNGLITDDQLRAAAVAAYTAATADATAYTAAVAAYAAATAYTAAAAATADATAAAAVADAAYADARMKAREENQKKDSRYSPRHN